MPEFIFEPVCIRIHADLSNVGINKIIDKLTSFGNVSFYGGFISVFLNPSVNEKKLRDFLLKNGIEEFFLEKIQAERCTNQTSLFDVWYKENYEKQLAYAIETQKQDVLKKINKNIAEISKKLKEKEDKDRG